MCTYMSANVQLLCSSYIYGANMQGGGDQISEIFKNSEIFKFQLGGDFW